MQASLLLFHMGFLFFCGENKYHAIFLPLRSMSDFFSNAANPDTHMRHLHDTTDTHQTHTVRHAHTDTHTDIPIQLNTQHGTAHGQHELDLFVSCEISYFKYDHQMSCFTCEIPVHLCVGIDYLLWSNGCVTFQQSVSPKQRTPLEVNVSGKCKPVLRAVTAIQKNDHV